MTLENKTARKIAWEISSGIRAKQFIGVKSKEVLAQELFSLKNRYTPDTMTTFEKSQFQKDLDKVVEGILQLPKEYRANLYNIVDKMLNP